MKKKLPVWIAVPIVFVCAVLILGAANGLTREKIDQYRAQSDLVRTGTARGFGGDVTVKAELNEDGAITSLVIETPDETEGIGKRASEAEFAEQFIGKSAPFAYGKDGIEALSGATITSGAVLEALNTVVPATVSAQGFGGSVTVRTQLNGDGTIASLVIETPDETEGIGKRASEAEFAEQFIGKAGPFAYGQDGIEALSGATVTSNAVLEALNAAVSGGAVEAAAGNGGDDSIQPEAPSTPDAGDDSTKPSPESDEGAGADAAAQYMRPRPVVATGEETAVGTGMEGETQDSVDAVSKYMRPRPAGLAANEEAQPESDAVSDSAAKYMRPRPVGLQLSAADSEVSAPAAETGSERADQYMRPKPAGLTKKTTEVETEGTPASDALLTPAEKYFRTRPVVPAVLENAEGEEASDEAAFIPENARKYMRPRPALNVVSEKQADEPDTTQEPENEVMTSAGPEEEEAEQTAGSAHLYMRPRPENLKVVQEVESAVPEEDEPVDTDGADADSEAADAAPAREIESVQAEENYLKYMRPRPAL